MTGPWILRRVRREARRRAGALAALAAAVAALAALGGAALLGTRTAAALVPLLDDNVQVIAYLGDELEPAQARRLAEALGQIPGVERARLVDGGEALGHLKAAAASLGAKAAVAEVEPGFLPRSVEIALAGGPDLPGRAAALAAKLRRLPGVREVDAMAEGIGRVRSWIAVGGRLGLVAVVLAAVAGAALLVTAFVTLARGRRREAQALALMGETAAGIHLPAGLAGATAALLGALLGLALVALAFPTVVRAVETAVGLGSLGPTPRLAPAEVAATLALAALLGLTGGWATSALPARTSDA